MAHHVLGLVATLTTLLLSGGLIAPPAQAAVTRTITLSTSASTISLGQTVTLKGAVTRSPVGTPVIIDRRTSTGWAKVKTVRTTTSGGAYRTGVKPSSAGTKTYRARVVAATVNGRRLSGAISPSRQVRVTSVIARTITLDLPPALVAYKTIKVSGTITRTPAGQLVSIECKDPTYGWDACGAGKVTSAGTFTDSEFQVQEVGVVPVRARVPRVTTSAGTLAAATSTTHQLEVYGADNSGPTKLVSVTPKRNYPSEGESLGSSISDSGRYVAFVSDAADLVPGVDPQGHRNVFVRDLQAGTTRLVSVARSGGPMKQVNWYDRVEAEISGNGRYVAFATSSPDLVAGDTNGRDDVFVTDLVGGTTVLASRTDGDALVTGDPVQEYSNLAISNGGRRVLFSSPLDGLVPEDTNGRYDAYVRDLDAGTTTLVSRNGAGQPLSGGGGFYADMSGNGGWVVFSSTSDDIGPAGGTDRRGLYRRNLSTGAVDQVYFTQGDPYTGFPSGGLDVSDDGSAVVFSGNVRTLDDQDDPYFSPTYLWRAGKGTVALSRNRSGVLVSATAPVISGDGSTVAFTSDADDLVAGDDRRDKEPGAYFHAEAYVHDVAGGTTALASVTDRGSWGGAGYFAGASVATGLTSTGSRVTFDSGSQWLIPGSDTNYRFDVFTRALG
ncbi:TolB family protein [Nocardioides marmoribigeumensis]|uniref:Tol biopolymer transport system component n=1 Tax=Nocardioides marmoribigeumensis TaxID=433649 RepID=A0ABU2BQ34_9ACTN|nr:hypothetical protein [Nocardioides marmoribigeumensis]MDR7360745.1 Tol biopolymer transport system component [Nocardioides marmoribigeumensis]